MPEPRKEEVEAANKFFDKEVKMPRWGWLPRKLLVGLHAAHRRGEVTAAQLREIGSNFAHLEKEHGADIQDKLIPKAVLRLEDTDPKTAVRMLSLYTQSPGMLAYFLNLQGPPEPPGAEMAKALESPEVVVDNDLILSAEPAVLPKMAGTPQFTLSMLFDLQAKRIHIVHGEQWREIHPLLHLLFSRREFPNEHRKPHFTYKVCEMNPVWLRKRDYEEKVKDGNLVLKPVLITRGDGTDKLFDVMTLHPISTRNLDHSKSIVGMVKRKRLDSFHINVLDPQYVPAAQSMAKVISRLTKKPVRVIYEKWRLYGGK